MLIASQPLLRGSTPIPLQPPLLPHKRPRRGSRSLPSGGGGPFRRLLQRLHVGTAGVGRKLLLLLGGVPGVEEGLIAKRPGPAAAPAPLAATACTHTHTAGVDIRPQQAARPKHEWWLHSM